MNLEKLGEKRGGVSPGHRSQAATRPTHVLTADINSISLGWPKSEDDHVIPATRTLVESLLDTTAYLERPSVTKHKHKPKYLFHNKTGMVEENILRRDTKIDGIKYKGGRDICFDENGRIVEGILAEDTEITLPDGLKVIAAEGTCLQLENTNSANDTSPRRVVDFTLAIPTVINNIELSAGTYIRFKKGNIYRIILASKTRIPIKNCPVDPSLDFVELEADSEIVYKKDEINIYSAGPLRIEDLSIPGGQGKRWDIQDTRERINNKSLIIFNLDNGEVVGIELKNENMEFTRNNICYIVSAGCTVQFDSGGKKVLNIDSAHRDAVFAINGIRFHFTSEPKFHENGMIASGSLASHQQIESESYIEDDILRFDPEGKIIS